MLIQNIKCLLNQTAPLDRIYIIDNASTDGTKNYIKKLGILNNESITYIKLNENTGGAGGFYKGIKRAYEDGFEYIWGMDDDAYPNSDALFELIKCKTKIGKNICLWSNCDLDNEFNDNYKEVNSWMFVGFYLPRNIINKVGYPRKDFFIYHDDSEYAYRIINNGFKIYKVRDSIINHNNVYSEKTIYKKTVFNMIIKLPKLSNWKMYYFIRNSIIMYNVRDYNRYKQIFIILPKLFIKICLLGTKQKRVFLKGYIHGILGISGKKVLPY
jgi:GT2 family glycosyltransferase